MSVALSFAFDMAIGITDDGRPGLGQRCGGVGGDLLVVLAHQDEAGDEGAEDLGEDVHGDFFPGEVLPDGEADCNGLGKGCVSFDAWALWKTIGLQG